MLEKYVKGTLLSTKDSTNYVDATVESDDGEDCTVVLETGETITMESWEIGMYWVIAEEEDY